MKSAIQLEKLSENLDELMGPMKWTDLAKVLGYRVMREARGEAWIRAHVPDGQYERVANRLNATLRRLGFDPTHIDTGL